VLEAKVMSSARWLLVGLVLISRCNRKLELSTLKARESCLHRRVDAQQRVDMQRRRSRGGRVMSSIV
jgi:hypothetical protein